MSLSLDLKNIKSSGIYRFVYDQSVVSPAEAETLRLLVGYSNKGPFNSPVYVETTADFERIFGKASRRLERKGIFFHRSCEEALGSGPILALNLKPFTEAEKDAYVTMDFNTISDATDGTDDAVKIPVTKLYNTNRFWTLDPDSLPAAVGGKSKYFTIAASDAKDSSNTVFIRKALDESVKGYDLTFREWYTESAQEVPDYVTDYMMDEKVKDYFVEVYVFKGKFTPELCSEGGVLERYFKVTADGQVYLRDTVKDSFGEDVDALYALAQDSNSNYLAGYKGITLPEWKDALGEYASIDILINGDQDVTKLIAKLDDSKLDAVESLDDIKALLLPQAKASPTDGGTYWGGPSDAYWDITSSKDDNSKEGEDGKTSKPSGKFIYLEGYTYDQKSVTAKSCLDVLTGDTGKGIREALTNHVDSEWRYLVDTFMDTEADNSVDTVSQSVRYKAILAGLVKAKDNAFGILNFPPVKLFEKSDKYKGDVGTALVDKFDIKKVAEKFFLPKETDGASWVAFYTPMVVSDGTVKTTIPSAPAVSNRFMEKWSTRQPYYVVAGPIYGVLSAEGLVGPDYNYSRSDLDVLEPMGVNALVYNPRYGTYVNSNQTAKQTPVSALSKVHIRELVIYLQDEIEDMLRGYQWELNTASLRATIKTKADTILTTVQNNGGLYSFVSICDETNNTADVIDNEMVILDVSIEPARAAGKMVQRLYIYKTGTISSNVQ